MKDIIVLAKEENPNWFYKNIKNDLDIVLTSFQIINWNKIATT